MGIMLISVKILCFINPLRLPYPFKKVHVNIGLYTNSHGFSGTEECWDKWSTGRYGPGGYEKQIPTSDAYLIYAVCENRNVGVLDFWFHQLIKKQSSNHQFSLSLNWQISFMSLFLQNL
jgi:hypothetical protein